GVVDRAPGGRIRRGSGRRHLSGGGCRGAGCAVTWVTRSPSGLRHNSLSQAWRESLSAVPDRTVDEDQRTHMMRWTTSLLMIGTLCLTLCASAASTRGTAPEAV